MSLILFAGGASAFASDDAELAQIFARFNHAHHEHPLQKAHLSCITCHKVGGVGDPQMTQAQLAETYLVPPKGVCHQCHAPGEGDLGAGAGMEVAPHRCETCHDMVRPPATHDAGWVAMHGQEAAINTATCRNCHERAMCADCHDRREDVTYDVHDRTWLTTHGIAARAAPADCDSCHAKTECTTCHESPSGFGRGL